MLENSSHLMEYGVCDVCEEEYAVAGLIYHRETKVAKKVCEEDALELLESDNYTQDRVEDSLDLEGEEQNV